MYNSIIIWNLINFCLYIVVVMKMYNVEVAFSLFPSLSGRNQICAMESNRQNYSPVYVSCAVFG